MEQKPKPRERSGQTSLYVPVSLTALLKAIAKAEDRPMNYVVARALHRYAEASQEYQESLSKEAA